MQPLNHLITAVKGAGEIASAVAWRLYMGNIKQIFMMETPCPTAVRRGVAFSEAVFEGHKLVEGVPAQRVEQADSIREIWREQKIALIVDPTWETIKEMRPHVVIDAVLAKKNLGTTISDAPVVIGLGPGFRAGEDVHFVIETNRGHNLGRIITHGSAEPDTGVPGNIGGYTGERVIRAPESGVLSVRRKIGDFISAGDAIGSVNKHEIRATISGVIRGLLRSGTKVTKGLKLGDIDPRAKSEYCYTISDKARSISGSVLEILLRHQTMTD